MLLFTLSLLNFSLFTFPSGLLFRLEPLGFGGRGGLTFEFLLSTQLLLHSQLLLSGLLGCFSFSLSSSFCLSFRRRLTFGSFPLLPFLFLLKSNSLLHPPLLGRRRRRRRRRFRLSPSGRLGLGLGAGLSLGFKLLAFMLLLLESELLLLLHPNLFLTDTVGFGLLSLGESDGLRLSFFGSPLLLLLLFEKSLLVRIYVSRLWLKMLLRLLLLLLLLKHQLLFLFELLIMIVQALH